METDKSLTVWFGKEIDINFVRSVVYDLYKKGYTVRAPFYIGYNISSEIVLNYLKNSLDYSDCLYLIGNEGSLLENIVEYARIQNKPIFRYNSVECECCKC